jgi:hypothetical protein
MATAASTAATYASPYAWTSNGPAWKPFDAGLGMNAARSIVQHPATPARKPRRRARDQPSGGNEKAPLERGFHVIAGAGFEPATFGL